MWKLCLLAVVVGACGGNDVDPRVLAGGGIGDGDIDGEVNVAVIDSSTEAPIAGAMVRVGNVEATTDAAGFVTVKDVTGKQTITAMATGYASAMYVGANGANVTITLTADAGSAVAQSTLSGTIAGYDAITVPAGHLKIAAILYSQTDNLGDAANSLPTPASGNICVMPAMCNWSVVTRTGTLTVLAAIADRDGHGTPTDASDDTTTIIGWAFKTGITVVGGVTQQGLVLDQVEAGNLQAVTIDFGTPPAGLSKTQAIPGIVISKDDVVQIPLFVATDPTHGTLPKPSVFAQGAGYRLTAVAQTDSGDHGAQSIVLRNDLEGTTLSAGTWPISPTDVMASRTEASFTAAAGAQLHSLTWERADTGVKLLTATIFDGSTAVAVPAGVELPSVPLRVRASGLVASFDLNDFSIDADREQLTGIASQPVEVP